MSVRCEATARVSGAAVRTVDMVELHLAHSTVGSNRGDHLLLGSPVPDAVQRCACPQQRNDLGSERLEAMLAGKVGLDGGRLILTDQDNELSGNSLLKNLRARGRALTAMRQARQVALALGPRQRERDEWGDARPVRIRNFRARPLWPRFRHAIWLRRDDGRSALG